MPAGSPPRGHASCTWSRPVSTARRYEHLGGGALGAARLARLEVRDATDGRRQLVAARHEAHPRRLLLEPRGDDGDLVGEVTRERTGGWRAQRVERERRLRAAPRSDEESAVELDATAAGDLDDDAPGAAQAVESSL